MKFREGEPLQGEQRTEHILSHPLGLFFCPGPDPAVDIEPGLPPGEKAFCPFGAQEFFLDEKPKKLAGKERGQPRVVEAGNLMEDPGLVHAALGHQEMEMRMGVDPVAKGLDGGNHSRYEIAPADRLKIGCQGLEGQAAELPQEPEVILEKYPQLGLRLAVGAALR